MNDKTQLLEEVGEVLDKKQNIDLSYLLLIILLVSFISIILFPKIYIHQSIYYKSRDISKLKGEYDMLKEENKLINASVESIKFKNQILDTLF